MLVIIALATTLLTGPGLNIVNYFYPETGIGTIREKTFKIMLSFANPKTGSKLLNLANQIVSRKASETLFTALHISPRSDLSPDNARIFEKESFAPIRKAAEEYGLALHTIYRNTNEISSEIITTCEKEKPDLLIMGSARALFSTDIFGGILKKIIHESECDVLIFNERNFSELRSVLIVFFGNGDDYLFEYARMLNHNSNRRFFTYHSGMENKDSAQVYANAGIPFESVSGSILDTTFLQSLDLIIVSEENWKALESKHNLPINYFPSLLIIHKSTGTNRLLKAYGENIAESTPVMI